MAEEPSPARILLCVRPASQVSRNRKSGSYSHQSEKTAEKRTIQVRKLPRYSATMASQARLLSA